MSLSKPSDRSATRLKCLMFFFWITPGPLIPKVEGCERCQIENMHGIYFRNDSENSYWGKIWIVMTGRGTLLGTLRGVCSVL